MSDFDPMPQLDARRLITPDDATALREEGVELRRLLESLVSPWERIGGFVCKRCGDSHVTCCNCAMNNIHRLSDKVRRYGRRADDDSRPVRPLRAPRPSPRRPDVPDLPDPVRCDGHARAGGRAMTTAEREAEVARLIQAGWLDPQCKLCREAIAARLEGRSDGH